MPIATTVVLPTACAVVRHWSARYSERRTSGAGRGRRKRAGHSTSPAAYSTLATRRVSRIDDGRRTGVLWPDRVFGQDRYAGPEHY